MNKYFHFENLISLPIFKDTSTPNSPKGGETPTASNRSAISLRNQLLLTVLPIVLTPLIIGSIIVYKIHNQNSENQIKPKLQAQALLAGEAAQDLLEKEVKLPEMVATNPLVIEAARRGSQQVEGRKLQQIPIEQVEKIFSASRLLQPNQTLNDYLRRTAKIGEVAQLSFTEKYGFNVAYTVPPYDFVQRDEQWWQEGKRRQRWISAPDFDPSVRLFSLSIVQAIVDPQSGEFLGLVKSVVPASRFDRTTNYLEKMQLKGSQRIQVIDSSTGRVITTATAKGPHSTRTAKGGKAIVGVGAALVKAFQEPTLDLAQVMGDLQKRYALESLIVNRFNPQTQENEPSASFFYQDKFYTITTIPRINWVAVASIDRSEIKSSDRDLMVAFALTASVLTGGIVVILLLLARQLSTPLVNLADLFDRVRSGDLDVVAKPVGNRETQTLGISLNNLVTKFRSLVRQQGKQKVFQQELRQLLSQVNSSIAENESTTYQLADRVLQQTTQITNMLNSVEDMSLSMTEVAEKAKTAVQMAHSASATVKTGGANLQQTVETIHQLRSTVAATVKKVKHLGELTQEIVQAIAPIERIAMKTNILAINANIETTKTETSHAGLDTTVAREVASLAERLGKVKTETEQIVDNIQWKTSEVMEAMEQEISQIVAGTTSVEKIQQDVQQIWQIAQKLENLVHSIADDTTTQAQTSRSLTQLKEEIVLVAERTADSSIEVSNAWQKTFALTKQLQKSVETCPIGDET